MWRRKGVVDVDGGHWEELDQSDWVGERPDEPARVLPWLGGKAFFLLAGGENSPVVLGAH